MSTERHPGVRVGRRLRTGERAVDFACRAIGSWPYAMLLAFAGVAGIVLSQAGGVTLLGLGLSILSLLEVTLVLMAARRARRTMTEVALYHLDQARRSSAVAEELRGDVRRLHADLARIAAHLEKSSQRRTDLC